MASLCEANAATPPPPGSPPEALVIGVEISGPLTVDEGQTASYQCTASYTDGTFHPVDAVWSTSSAGADINSLGVLSANNVNTDQDVAITASFSGFLDSYDITVKFVAPVLTSIEIEGPSALDEETPAQFSCVANYSDGSSVAVDPVWSLDSAHASISSTGLLTANDVLSDQSVLISARFGELSDSQTVSIRYVPPVQTSLSIIGPAGVTEGSTAQYLCMAYYSDGTSALIDPAWTVSPSYASISATGLLTANNVTADQSVSVSASYGGQIKSLAVAIGYVAPTLASIQVAGASSVDEQDSTQYTCKAFYSDGTSATVSPIWSVSPSYASISSAGLLTANNVTADQSVNVTASYGGQTKSRSVAINYIPALTSLVIEGPSLVEELTNGVLFTCAAVYDDDSSEVVESVVWSGNSSGSSISAAGDLSVGNLVADEILNITASFDGITVSQEIMLKAVGTRVFYPLSNVHDSQVRAELWIWDEIAQTHHLVEEISNPEELVLEGLDPDRWYWLVVEEYNELSGQWETLHTSGWVNM
ncbi:hypothetical protein [Pontiella sulfatireligans]|nr:hypothetical protein [Pontiella sulfatireligans]